MNKRSDGFDQGKPQSRRDNFAMFPQTLERTLRLAARAHRNQTRKASDLPYFQHPASVVLILARCGIDDDNLLAAAALHDVLEDTEITESHLRKEFCSEIVSLVLECSERKKSDSGQQLPWRQRKEEHIEVVRQASIKARAIVLADKLHNLASMVFDLQAGEELWRRFNAPANDIIWYHRHIVEAALDTNGSSESSSVTEERLRRLGSECFRLIDLLAESTR